MVATSLKRQGIESRSTRSTLVGIHIRRGDKHDDHARGTILATARYILKSVQYMRERYSTTTTSNGLHFVVFSDDLVWSQQTLSGEPDVTFISDGRTHAHLEFAMLTMCHHHIITIGSFGWWAAYLAGGTTLYWDMSPRPGSWQYSQMKKDDYFPRHWIPFSHFDNSNEN